MARFDRIASVEVGLRNNTFNGYIGSIKLSALRISFSIQKNLSWSTNTASVKFGTSVKKIGTGSKIMETKLSYPPGIEKTRVNNCFSLVIPPKSAMPMISQKSSLHLIAETEKEFLTRNLLPLASRKRSQSVRLSKRSPISLGYLFLSLLLLTILFMSKGSNMLEWVKMPRQSSFKTRSEMERSKWKASNHPSIWNHFKTSHRNQCRHWHDRNSSALYR